MVPILGSHTFPFPAKTCLLIRLGVDFISLVMQAAGGGIAGQAFSSNVDTSSGTYTMVAGILFQLTSTTTYSILMSIVFFRGFQSIRASKLLNRLAVVMVLAASCMIARGDYRSIEMLQRWTGYLNTHEVYIIVLDGALMVFAVVVLNPGKLLAQARDEKGEQTRGMKEASSDEETKGNSSKDSEVFENFDVDMSSVQNRHTQHMHS